MKRKPWSLVILALLHILAPVGNFLLNAVYSGRGISGQWEYWFEVLSKHFLLMYVALPILAGIFIYICRRWSYWAYLACVGLILLSNIYSYTTYQNLNSLLMLVPLLIVDIIIVAYFVVPSVQKVYFDPRLRWWEAAPRYKFDQPGQMNNTAVTIKNMSQGGLFMSSDSIFKVDDSSTVTWSYEGQNYEVKGQVVYKVANPSGPGYGVKFEHTPETEKNLKKLNHSLHTKGLIVKERLPGTEDGFTPWLKNLLKTGKGLIPKTKA